jgi:hypothetical protein
VLAAAALLAGAAPARAGFVPSSISGSFNSTAISGSSYVWFNSVLTPTSTMPSTPFTVFIRSASIQFKANGTTYYLAVPDANVTFNNGGTPSTSFSGNTWTTLAGNTGHTSDTTPNAFASGLVFQAPAGGLPGGVGPVTWTATFASTAGSMTYDWEWAAAVYSQLPSNYNALGVFPLDNGDLAGTPENEKSFLRAGATGLGGTNYTGTYVAASAFATPQATTAPAPPGLVLLLTGLAPVAACSARRRLARRR